MLARLTIGKKLVYGFCSLTFLILVLGAIALIQSNRAATGFKTYRNLARDTVLSGNLQAEMLMIRMNAKDYLITSSQEDIDQYQQYRASMLGYLEDARKEIENPTRAAAVAEASEMIEQYDVSFEKVIAYMKERHRIVNDVLNVKGPLMENTLTDIMISAENDGDAIAVFHAGLAMKHLLLARLYSIKFLDANEPEYVQRVRDEFAKFDEQTEILDRELQNPRRRELLAIVLEADKIYQSDFQRLSTIIKERNEVIRDSLDLLGPVFAKKLEEVKNSVKAEQDALGPKLEQSNNLARIEVLVLSALSLIVGGLLSFFITRSIVRPLRTTTSGLSQSAEEVSSAASQVAGGSQSVSTGASEQASSIEETSSSLEEMAASTAKNAENGEEANRLMGTARKVVDQANEAMSEVTSSMSEIATASEATQKIVKTIDEIAFQTNLLALNAAVEAARAGEAGAGFAVVADEVRSLAMRVATAAKDTAEQIEGTVEKVEKGGKLVERTNNAFSEVSQSVETVESLVSDIATASREQAQGIEQINAAVSQMDSVVQKNAASAEEFTSSSEELSVQSNQLKELVKDLIVMTEGAHSGSDSSSANTGEDFFSSDRTRAISPNRTANAFDQDFASSASKEQPETIDWN